jgi:tRNA uridine 5-carboxymethylaminomethyl modification enzyme
MSTPDAVSVTVAQALSRPTVSLGMIRESGFLIDTVEADEHVDTATLEAEFKYRGYLRREEAQLARTRAQEARVIPLEFDYRGIPGLSREVVERLSAVRPSTLGQAGRVPGVTPAAVAILSSRLARGGRIEGRE